MDQQKMLPHGWVERIFLRLQGVYGREFTSQFSMIDPATGIDVGLENAKQVWAEELANFGEWPEAIAYALKNLPDRSPNVIRFRELCRLAPARSSGPMITRELSAEDREKAKENIRKIREMLASTTLGTRQ